MATFLVIGVILLLVAIASFIFDREKEVQIFATIILIVAILCLVISPLRLAQAGGGCTIP